MYLKLAPFPTPPNRDVNTSRLTDSHPLRLSSQCTLVKLRHWTFGGTGAWRGQVGLDHSPSRLWLAGFRTKWLLCCDSRRTVWRQYLRPNATVGVLTVPSKGSGYPSGFACTRCKFTESHPANGWVTSLLSVGYMPRINEFRPLFRVGDNAILGNWYPSTMFGDISSLTDGDR